MSELVKWGILGSAGIARTQFLPGLADAKNAVLHAVGSRSLAKAQAVADEFGAKKAYSSYEEVLDDPHVEAVYIPLPNNLHSEWTIKALRAKKHVLCEKPMALSVEQSEEMLAVAKTEGMLFMEGFMYRFHPQIFKTAELLEEGRIGTVRLIRGSFSFVLQDPKNIRLAAGLGGGSIMDVGCYPIHFSNLMFGSIPESVTASAHYDGDLDLSMTGLLNYSGDRQAVFDCSFEMEDRQSVEIVGDQGTITIPKPWRPDRSETSIFVRTGNVTEEIAFPVNNPYQLEVEHFSECIREGNEPLMPGTMGRGVLAVIEACHASARSGKCVELQA